MSDEELNKYNNYVKKLVINEIEESFLENCWMKNEYNLKFESNIYDLCLSIWINSRLENTKRIINKISKRIKVLKKNKPATFTEEYTPEVYELELLKRELEAEK